MLFKLGVTELAILALGETWDNMRHYIRTVYGISEDSYTSTAETPLFGAVRDPPMVPLLVVDVQYNS